MISFPKRDTKELHWRQVGGFLYAILGDADNGLGRDDYLRLSQWLGGAAGVKSSAQWARQTALLVAHVGSVPPFLPPRRALCPLLCRAAPASPHLPGPFPLLQERRRLQERILATRRELEEERLRAQRLKVQFRSGIQEWMAQGKGRNGGGGEGKGDSCVWVEPV